MKTKAKATKPSKLSAKKKNIQRPRFDPEKTPLEILEAIVRGSSLIAAVKARGFSESTFYQRRRQHPLLDEAVKLACELKRWHASKVAEAAQRTSKEEIVEANRSMSDYVIGNLPYELQAIWREWSEVEDDQEACHTFDELTRGSSKRSRQMLYLQCYMHSSFNLSIACRRTGISRTNVEFWLDQDPEFASLLREMQRVRKDYVEGALMDLVALRNPQAVIFANKTLNRDRGYSEQLDVNVTNESAAFRFEDLDLDLDTKRKILEAIRKKRDAERGVIQAAVVQRIENREEGDLNDDD